MQLKPKSNSVITHAIAGNVITFTVKDAGEVKLDLGKMHTDLVGVWDGQSPPRATVHGMVQRIADAAAISRNVETGLPATPMDKLNAMRGLVDHYNSGSAEWRIAGVRAAPAGGFLLSALCEVYANKTREQLAAWLKKQSAASRAALSASPRFAEIITRLQQAAAADIDVDDLTSELDDEE